jgi:hypothetical protein
MKADPSPSFQFIGEGAFGDNNIGELPLSLSSITWVVNSSTVQLGNRRSHLRSNNSIELSMIVFVIASTIPRISINPIIKIAQDTLF